MTKEMKTDIMAQAAAVKRRNACCILWCVWRPVPQAVVCLAARSTGWAHHCGTTFAPECFFGLLYVPIECRGGHSLGEEKTGWIVCKARLF